MIADLRRTRSAVVAAEPVDWDDVSDRVDLCLLWLAALDAVDSEGAERVGFQLSQSDLDESFGVSDCT